MPVQVNGLYQGIVERMLELASTRTPWHRRLWRGGTVQLARELLDDCIRPGTPPTAITDQRKRLSAILNTDPGITAQASIQPTLQGLAAGLTSASHNWIVLREQVHRMTEDYLTNWADALDASPTLPLVDTEGAARRIAAHLFDSGMDRSSVFAWLWDAKRGIEVVKLTDMLREIDRRLKAPPRRYEFCVPLLAPPRITVGSPWPEGWLPPRLTRHWKNHFAPAAPSVRHHGSLLIAVQARDVNAAAEQARIELAVLASKFQLISHLTFEPASNMWSSHTGGEFPATTTNRLITMRAFERLDRVYDISMPDFITSAIALIQPLRTGASHIAVMSGWSAIESLLVGADDSDIVAAERFSLIVAASMVRAEFNWLAKSYAKSNGTPEAAEIRAAKDSLTRSQLFQQHVINSSTIHFSEEVDQLALHRVRPLLTDPQSEIPRIRDILTHEFTRLYRKRNMIAHNGRVHDPILSSIAHTMAPLIGAGVDQIIYAGLKTETPPIELSAIAHTRLAHLTPTTTHGPGNALELLEL